MGGAASRLAWKAGVGGLQGWKPVVTLQRLARWLQAEIWWGGGLHKWAVALIRQGGGPRPEQSQQWARSSHQPIDSAGIGETAAKRKICAAIFNDIPTRPPTLTIKKSTTTPLLHRKSRGLDIACHPE